MTHATSASMPAVAKPGTREMQAAQRAAWALQYPAIHGAGAVAIAMPRELGDAAPRAL